MDVPDRRASERMPVNHGSTCSFAAPVQLVNTGAARIKDVSMDGIGLILTNKVEVGALLAIVLEKESNKEFRLTALIRVAHATPVQGGYLVGGIFATPLTDQEFTTLLL